MELSVVVVSWNVRHLLAACLESIPAAAGGLSHEVVVVDNASSDSTADMVRQGYPAVRLFANAENVGFGRANNQGIQASSGRWVALVNPDVELEPGSLASLVDVLRAEPQAGLAAPRIVLPSGETQFDTAALPRIYDGLPGVYQLRRALGDRRWPRRRVGGFDCVARECVLGVVMVFPRAVVEQIGGIPEATFMYGEEWLIGDALRRRGLRVLYVPAIRVLHHGDQSGRQRWSEVEKRVRTAEIQIALASRLLPPWKFAVWNSLNFFGNFVRWATAPVRPRSRALPLRDLVRLSVNGFSRQA